MIVIMTRKEFKPLQKSVLGVSAKFFKGEFTDNEDLKVCSSHSSALERPEYFSFAILSKLSSFLQKY